GEEPRSALLVERDLAWKDAAQTARAPVRVAPYLWQETAWRPHSLQIASGTLVQMGAVADAVPGLTLWELPAPAGRTELFFPPRDLYAPCEEWVRSAGAGLLSADTLTLPERAGNRNEDAACVLPFTPPFGLEVRRLAPAPAALAARSRFAAGLVAAPCTLALLLLCMRPRRSLSPRRFMRLASLSWVSAFLGALLVWRLLWAHRIDVMRQFEPIGSLVLQNQAFVALTAAALAAA